MFSWVTAVLDTQAHANNVCILQSKFCTSITTTTTTTTAEMLDCQVKQLFATILASSICTVYTHIYIYGQCTTNNSIRVPLWTNTGAVGQLFERLDFLSPFYCTNHRILVLLV